MIADVPPILIVLMVLLTLLGGAMGYCIALLVVKKSVRKAIHSFRLEHDRLIFEAQRRLTDEDIFEPSDLLQSDLRADKVISHNRTEATELGRHGGANEDTRVSQPQIMSHPDLNTETRKDPQYSTVSKMSLDFANTKSSDIDIPAIAESELPKEVEGLDFTPPHRHGKRVIEGA